jgi:glutamate dehydrogenase
MDANRGSISTVNNRAAPRDSAATDFLIDLFGRVPPEDLAAYPPDVLAGLALRAFAHLSGPRLHAAPDIALHDLSFERDGRRVEVTVIEVVNDNMPFLLDSTLAEVVDRGLDPLLVAHPILAVERDAGGRLVRFAGEATSGTIPGARRESLVHIHVGRLAGEVERADLADALRRVYADVAAATRDWPEMRARLAATGAAYRAAPPPLPRAEVDEAVAFLDWAHDNLVLLGVRAYRFAGGDTAADPVPGSGLGILRDQSVKVLRRGTQLVLMTPEIRAFLEQPRALIITKANVKSRVHRRAYLDYIGVKLFSAAGQLEGELRVVGLFSAGAYTSPAVTVPYLRLKVALVRERAGYDPQSYAGRALEQVLETYPRDELFQIDADLLYHFALQVMNLSERPRTRVLARADAFDRFVSVIVYVRKDRYDSDVRRRIGEYLAELYEGHVSAAYPSYPEGPLARTHFIIGHGEGAMPRIGQATLEDGVERIVLTWADVFVDHLRRHFEPRRAAELASRYAQAFRASYREAFDPEQAIADAVIIERLGPGDPYAVDLYRAEGDDETRINLKVFSYGASLLLSDRVPLLENLGFRVINERTYRIQPSHADKAERVWLHDMTLARRTGLALDIARLEQPLEAALLAILSGAAESDGYNALIVEAGLVWTDVAVVRTLGRYLQQIRIPYAQDYIAAALARHPDAVSEIVGLFRARFDPAALDGSAREQAQALRRAAIKERLEAVTSLDDDLILRRFANLIEAAVRTNAYQRPGAGGAPEAIAFKFDGRIVEALPAPHPLYEIFLNSPRVEGLHLRFGKVARGGLRWTDRPQDYRTEILGLVKAQQVKNAVIVPVGAKGGFFPKKLPPAANRQAWMEEGTQAYRLFVRTLLELTDNIVGDAVVPPPDTVRHDSDDPYLVVAADKGTATFSDLANAISIEKGHWLGDAFASGGSQGYDHKAMGITARGGWEAVKRHFREMDIDIQTEPVTVAGVGDMSGDVFGNGMLLSKSVKLVAAFDHRDIFLDPQPDAAAAWAECERLFRLPRSSWADYDRSLISPGGGVFSRQSKSIALAPEARQAIGLDKAEATPAEVMRAILKAPVGLLWFGGIGTYIRASSETDDAAGDRANDAVRITGADVRAQVIGEGANLGVTQRGRIEAARAGVRLNTDAIDNSAGVNTSDVEVNIKIALATPERDGRLGSAERNALLAAMTEEVGDLVLRNNYLQPLAISLTERRKSGEIGFARRLMQVLEGQGRLDRALEFLPSNEELGERARRGEGLTRPEIAVLLAYAKLALHDALLGSRVPDDPYLGRELERYFPVPLQQRFPDAIASHRLRREIIATQLANAIINRGGPTFVTRMTDATGADAPVIAAAYAATRDSFGLSELGAAVDALDGHISGALQLDLYARLQALMMSRIVWFIRNVDFATGTLDAIVGLYQAGIAEVASHLPSVLSAAASEEVTRRGETLAAQGVPRDLASAFAALQDLGAAPDIVLVAQRAERSIRDIAATHFAVDAHFGLGALAAAAAEIPVSDYYDRLALDRAIDGIAAAHRALTGEVVGHAEPGPAAVSAWQASRSGEAERIRDAVEAIVSSGLTLSKLTVAASLLGDLAKA